MERRREHGSNLARLETAPELKKAVDPQPLFSRRLSKLKAKISGHAVCPRVYSLLNFNFPLKKIICFELQL